MKKTKWMMVLAVAVVAGQASADFAPFVNHARSGTATQVGTFLNSFAPNAIDGNYGGNQDWEALAVGPTGSPAWWRLDLNQDVTLGSIVIHEATSMIGFWGLPAYWAGQTVNVYDSSWTQIGSTYTIDGAESSYILTNGGAGWTNARHIEVLGGGGAATESNVWLAELEAYTEVVPEPASIGLMGASTVGLFFSRRIRRRKRLGASILPVSCDNGLDDFSSEEAVCVKPAAGPSVWQRSMERVAVAGEAWQCRRTEMDKRFWNGMVALHEKGCGAAQACAKRAADCLDAALARIMK